MLTRISLLTLTLLIASSQSSSAQPVPPPVLQPQRARLNKGQAAPFAGNLLSDEAVAKIVTDYEQRIAKLQLELEKARREAAVQTAANDAVCTAKLSGEVAKQKACMDDKERQSKLFFTTLDKQSCPSPAWNYVSFIGGAAIGGGICALAAGVK